MARYNLKGCDFTPITAVHSSGKARSHKNIKLTSHCILRAEERLNITKKDELRKLASTARCKGININSIRAETYEKLGLTEEEFKFIKSRFINRTNSTDIYLHKGNIFIFVGKRGSTLKTVVNLKKLVS